MIRRVLPALLACALGAACADVWGFKDITASGDGGSDAAGNGAGSGGSGSGLGTGSSSAATTSSGASSASGSSGASSGGDSGTSSATGGGSSSGEMDGSGSSSGTAGNDGGHEAGTSSSSGTSSSTSSSSSSGTSSGSDSGVVLTLIDNMDSMNGNLDGTAPGLTGNWFEYNDGTGTQSPTPMGTGKVLFPTKLSSAVTLGGVTGSYVMSTSGSGFTTWGAGIGFYFKSTGGAYNVSAYSGFLFYAQAASGANTTFRFDVPTKGTSTTGGVCSPTGTCGGASPTCCGDHYGSNVTGLSTTWTQITIPFTDLAQQGYGMAVSFDKTEVYGCDFQVAEDTTFNFSIADVYFITP